MISEESSAKPGIVLCPHYHFLLWNWKSMSSAVLVYDFFMSGSNLNIMCVPRLPSQVFQGSFKKVSTINNSDGGMRNVFMYWKNKFPRLFAKILPYLRVWHVVTNILTYFNYIWTMQFCECRFFYLIFVKFQDAEINLKSSQ